jgi:hypothetical protein
VQAAYASPARSLRRRSRGPSPCSGICGQSFDIFRNAVNGLLEILEPAAVLIIHFCLSAAPFRPEYAHCAHPEPSGTMLCGALAADDYPRIGGRA